jgi:uncharacterized protein (DUF362 family)
MSRIFVQKTKNRRKFLRKVFKEAQIEKEIEKVKTILIKPNIVSFEPYPTTTHPELLEECLKFFLEKKKEVLVADSPAPDAGLSKKIIENHPLKRVCEKFKIPLIDLTSEKTREVKIAGLRLRVFEFPFALDFILSLPVLKSHKVCQITGALKNQFGFLAPEDRIKLHLSYEKDLLHKVIAELNLIFKVNFFVVDAIETLINTNEIRHGGELKELGYMLAGKDPLNLDIQGLKLLQKVDPKLKNKRPEDILHLQIFQRFSLQPNNP